MIETIEWIKLDETRLVSHYPKYYYFKPYNDGAEQYSRIIEGWVRHYDGKWVIVQLGHTTVDIPLNYFSHYAEIPEEG